MIRMNSSIIYKTSLALLVMFFCACTTGKKSQENKEKASSAAFELKYATGFSVHEFASYKQVIVYNPWDIDKTFATYYLVKSDTCQTPSDGLRVQIPLQKVAISSCTHIEPLRLLGELDVIAGICSPNLIYNAELQEKHAQGKLVDLGDAMKMNVEKTLQLNPDGVFMSGYSNSDDFTAHLEKVSVPIIYNNEWMEKTLLARAEWIKFMSLFFGQEHEADSVFQEIDKKYQQLKKQAMDVKVKPNLMTGNNFRGTWYVPAGDNYMSHLFTDAGASYRYTSDERSGSIPLTVEQVVYEFSDADVWVGSSANTLKELVEMDEKHTYFNAYKAGEVYNFNKRTNATYANDFWEMGVSRPDLILADMIKILHPEIMEEHEFFFVSKVE